MITKQPEVQIVPKVQQGLAITHDVRMRQAQAEMFARYHLAAMVPRDWHAVEAKLMIDCDNPDFAAEAFYSKPTGSGRQEGLSIRFAERALQHMRNLSVDVSPDMEDDWSVHHRVTVIDLESNTPTSETFKVEKTVERSSVKDTDTVLSQRTNSQGQTVYLISATEDQMLTKVRAQSSKAKRNLICALIPADVRLRCLERCQAVFKDKQSKDPAAATKDIVAAFIGIGVDVPELKEYLGKSPQSATPAQVAELRSIYVLIRDGDLTWQDALEAKRELEAAKGSKAEFVAQKQKEKEKQKAKRGTQPAGNAATPAPRRGRSAAAGTDTATDAGAGTGAATTPDAAAAPAPPKPRANRRGDDDDASDAGGASDQSSNPAGA